MNKKIGLIIFSLGFFITFLGCKKEKNCGEQLKEARFAYDFYNSDFEFLYAIDDYYYSATSFNVSEEICPYEDFGVDIHLFGNFEAVNCHFYLGDIHKEIQLEKTSDSTWNYTDENIASVADLEEKQNLKASIDLVLVYHRRNFPPIASGAKFIFNENFKYCLIRPFGRTKI